MVNLLEPFLTIRRTFQGNELEGSGYNFSLVRQYKSTNKSEWLAPRSYETLGTPTWVIWGARRRLYARLFCSDINGHVVTYC